MLVHFRCQLRGIIVVLSREDAFTLRLREPRFVQWQRILEIMEIYVMAVKLLLHSRFFSINPLELENL